MRSRVHTSRRQKAKDNAIAIWQPKCRGEELVDPDPYHWTTWKEIFNALPPTSTANIASYGQLRTLYATVFFFFLYVCARMLALVSHLSPPQKQQQL